MSRKYLAFATVFALVALSACGRAADVVTDTANTVTDGVGNVAEGVVDVASDAMEATGDAMMDAGDTAMDAAGDAMEATGDAMEEVADVIDNAIEDYNPGMDEKEDDAMMEDEDKMEDDAMMEDEGAAMKDEAAMEDKTATYTGYVDGVIGNGQESVIFFHADWCPTCVSEDAKLVEKAANNGLNRNVYKVDYDSNTELRQQLGVTSQSTFVLINDAGEVVESVTFPSAEQLEEMVNPV